jgi:predicted ATPase with chaperone activity
MPLARALTGLLPPLSVAEALEAIRNYSVAGPGWSAAATAY